MEKFNYSDIDLYYYHSIDIDFTRLSSILKYGILSANKIKEKNVPYYHRNYINASCLNDYISISQFSNTLWHYYHIKNELYESSANRIVFILNGYIDSLEKQSRKNRFKFTTELNVKDEIKKEDILGIIVRKHDLNKKIIDIPFNINYSHFNDSIKKCFDTIQFYKDTYGIELDYNNLYLLIGKLMEAKVLTKDEYKDILKNISLFMQNYINNIYKIVLDSNNPTLKDVLLLYKEQIPIYVMTKYDVKDIMNEKELINNPKEGYETTYPNRKYINLSTKEREQLEKQKLTISEITNLESQLNKSDEKIYFDEYKGPLTKEGEIIIKKIKTLRNSL